MGPPLVSVILPTYNRKAFLLQAVASMQAQTWPHWKLLVIDDGSTDGSGEALPGDPRIGVLRREHTGNVAALRNAGLDAATGDYVGFLDSDDRWTPGKLVWQVQRLEEEPAAGWCHGAYVLVGAEGRPVPLKAGIPWQAREGNILEAVLTTDADITLQTVLVRRGIAQAIRFDERILVDDYDFVVQLAARAPAVAIPGHLLAEVREHSERTTHGRFDHGLGSVWTYRKVRRQLSDRRLRRICTRQALALGRHYLANARARGELLSGLRRVARAWVTA